MNFSQLNFGDFAIKIYGIFLAIAFFVVVWKTYKNIQKANLDIYFFVHHFWRWLSGGIILGRIVAILLLPEVWERYGEFSFFAFWEGGISFLGAAIGFLTVLFIDFHLNKKDPFRWVDLVVLPFYIGVIIIDIAGFLTGTVYGTETSMPWGIRYETFGVESINPVHPVTLYALVFHVWILLWLKPRMKSWEKFPGRLAAWGAFLFITTDFFIQFLTAQSITVFGLLSVTQIVEVLLMVGLWMTVKVLHGKR